VVFERPKVAKAVEDDAKSIARSKEKVGPARLVNGKMVNAKGKPVTGKQMTLGGMMAKKASPAVSP
jgi:DNA repair protein RAD5